MAEPHVITALRGKRTRIAGEIMAAQHAIDQRREELAQIDSVIRMFAPDCNPDMISPIRPGSHGLFFSYRELPRLCLDILRKAKGPIRFDAIVDRVVDAKGFTLDLVCRGVPVNVPTAVSLSGTTCGLEVLVNLISRHGIEICDHSRPQTAS